MSKYHPSFDRAIVWSEGMLLGQGDEVDAGKWQGIPTQGHPSLITKEILNLSWMVPVHRPSVLESELIYVLAEEIRPNLLWADEHFEERVGGIPYNPDPSHVRWPWWRGQDDTTKVDGKFTHTYSERFWPKFYERKTLGVDNNPIQKRRGIRYDYGDLNDVVELLWDEPHTRQAYLPIFFPEDTGVSHGGRVPCTLGYHFLLRHNHLHMWYDIRSCDAVRHFRDDIYLAVRLQLWVLEILQRREHQHVEEEHHKWGKVVPGFMYFKAHSFHVHAGDLHHLQEQWHDKMAS